MARNKRAPRHLIVGVAESENGRIPMSLGVAGRLRTLNAVMQQAQARFALLQAETAAKEQGFAEAMRIYAELVGIDPESEFQYNLDEGWITPAKSV